MSYYVAAYDVEAIYPWWEIGQKPYSAKVYRESVSYKGKAKTECLEGIASVAEVHTKHNIPATFFLVAELVKNASAELLDILKDPLFDIQCHSFTHENLIEIENNNSILTREIADSKHLIEDTFGCGVIGFTTPGSFTHGLIGKPKILEVLWKSGYNYIRSVGKGPFDTSPAPLTQPFWYSEEGYPELLELALHGWHDNILSGQPFPTYWPPIFPWGYPSKMPETPYEMYEVFAPFIDHCVSNDILTFVPCFHPWSVYRVDKKAVHLDLIFTHAKRYMEVVSCSGIYKIIDKNKSLANNHLKISNSADF